MSRRPLVLLSGSFAAVWAAIAITAGPGPAAFARLAGDASLAGLHFALFSVGAAVGAAVGGRVMDRVGRRRVLAFAHAWAAAGYALAGVAVVRPSFPLFVAGVVLLASGSGAAYLTRLAAAELLPPAKRGQGMAWVLLGAAAGALAGPLVLMLAPGASVWFVAAPLPLVAAGLVLAGPEPRDVARTYESADAAPAEVSGRFLGAYPLLAGVAAVALAQGVMTGLMGVAGVWMAVEGLGARAMGVTMALHFVGMFALSPFVGRIADRVGRRAAILAGLAVLAAGSLTLAAAQGGLVFAAGLFLVGLGWSFAYVGATVLVTDVTTVAVRARVLGRVDLASSLTAAVGAAAAGWWFAAEGLAALGVAAAALAVVPALAMLAVKERAPVVATA